MKEYTYEMDEQLYQYSLEAMRSREDLLRLLSQTVKFIISQELLKENSEYQAERISSDNKLILRVDKMSRLFYCMGDKIFSYQFPLTIVEKENKVIIVYDKLLVIDSMTSSMLISVFDAPNMLSDSLIDIYERIDDILKNDYDDPEFNDDVFFSLVKHLMIFEPGYIRYDDDPDENRVDPVMHPRYHFDINYSTGATYKIGLSHEIQPEYIVSLLDINQNCIYLK